MTERQKCTLAYVFASAFALTGITGIIMFILFQYGMLISS